MRIALVMVGLLASIASPFAISASKDNLYRYLNQAEARYGLPHNTLVALAYTESSMNPFAINADGVSFYPDSKDQAVSILKGLNLNPYVIKVKTKEQPSGINYFYSSAEAAARAVESIRSRNAVGDMSVLAMPVGKNTYYRRLDLKNTGLCLLQVSNKYHGVNAGRTVNEILDPTFCVNYGAQFIKQLIEKHGFEKGVGCYYTCGSSNRARKDREEYFQRFNRHFQRLNAQTLAIAGVQ